MTQLGRLVVSTMLALLVVLAIALPQLVSKKNIQPSLDKARAVVKQTQDRAKEMEEAAGAIASDSLEDSVVLPEAVELQKAANEAVAAGGRDIEKLNAVRDKAAKYNEARLKLTD
jgi:hypothetical protein